MQDFAEALKYVLGRYLNEFVSVCLRLHCFACQMKWNEMKSNQIESNQIKSSLSWDRHFGFLPLAGVITPSCRTVAKTADTPATKQNYLKKISLG